MTRITSEHLTSGIVTEHEVHQFVTEASDLGLRAGTWPERIETTLGNGLDFIRTAKRVVDGDLIYVRYVQANGCISLKIFND